MKYLTFTLVVAILTLFSCTKETPETREVETPRTYNIKSIYLDGYVNLSGGYGLQIVSNGVSVYNSTYIGTTYLYCQPNVTTSNDVTFYVNTGGNFALPVDTFYVNLDSIAALDPVYSADGKTAIINFE